MDANFPHAFVVEPEIVGIIIGVCVRWYNAAAEQRRVYASICDGNIKCA